MVRLDRDASITLGIGLLCVVAMAVAAGTLGSVLVPGGDGVPGLEQPDQNPDFPGENNSGGDGTYGEVISGERGGSVAQITMCVRFLDRTAGMALYFAAFLLAFYLLARLRNASLSMLAGYALSPFIVLGYFFFTDCPTADGTMPGEGGDDSALDSVAGTEVLDATNVSPLVPAAIFGVALLGAVLLFYTSTDDEELEPEEEPDVDEEDVEALGRAAAAAADRLEGRNADVDNEVYRAWGEMTALLDVPDPETSTPGMFADAAVEAGIDPEHAGELTRLFEEVRYGHKDPEAREEQALSIFREIEAEYAPDDGAATARSDEETRDANPDADGGSDARPADDSEPSAERDDSDSNAEGDE